MSCDDPQIQKIIAAQGWTDDTVLRLLWSFIEGTEGLAAQVEAFMERIAKEENEE